MSCTDDNEIQPSKFAQIYGRIRSSKGFLIALVAYIAVWMQIHFVTGFDPGLGDFNSIMSSEASINLAVFAILAEAQYQWSKRQMRIMQQQNTAIKHQAEATHALLGTVHDLVKTQVTMLKALGSRVEGLEVGLTEEEEGHGD